MRHQSRLERVSARATQVIAVAVTKQTLLAPLASQQSRAGHARPISQKPCKRTANGVGKQHRRAAEKMTAWHQRQDLQHVCFPTLKRLGVGLVASPQLWQEDAVP